MVIQVHTEAGQENLERAIRYISGGIYGCLRKKIRLGDRRIF